VRVIAFFPKTLVEIDQLIREEFIVVERTDKREDLVEEERFGYASIHYIVRIGVPRATLPEYERFGETTAEIQIRTILQHAWAEIEHDIQYKSASAIPSDIRRRFMALAGMLEIADREFQAVQDADRALTESARGRIQAGQLEGVEITPSAVKAYLDLKLGADGRISDYSYEWVVRLLKKLGFKTLAQVEKCIAEYDDDRLSRIVSESRQGQTTRFEYMLMAGMGDKFIQRHIFAGEPWYGAADRDRLTKMHDAQVAVRNYDPLMDQGAA
jgi:putative GTP pyrophosphokinase